MKNSEINAALEMLQNPSKVKVQLEKDLKSINIAENPELPEDSELKKISEELLVGIAESLDEVRPEYAVIRKQLIDKHEDPKRNFGEVFDIGVQAYHLIKNHWGEIAFIILALDHYGFLNKIKKNKRIKRFLELLIGKK